MKIGIVGSREFKDFELIKKVLFRELTPLSAEVITGGARGVDQFAIDFCRDDCTPCTIVLPRDKTKKQDYLYRNIEIITLSDKIIAFWDGKSRGTKFTMEYAKSRNKEIILVKINKKYKEELS